MDAKCSDHKAYDGGIARFLNRRVAAHKKSICLARLSAHSLRLGIIRCHVVLWSKCEKEVRKCA